LCHRPPAPEAIVLQVINGREIHSKDGTKNGGINRIYEENNELKGKPEMSRLEDMENFYTVLDKLRQKTDYRYLGKCNGKMKWPKRGLYFFFEEGELREGNERLRVVRVGTHAVSRNSNTHLWDRLRGHRGNMRGKYKDGGNHRGSIFRLHVGTALVNKEDLHCESWSNGSSASPEIRSKEYPLEIKVSRKIRSMPLLWLEANDEPGPDSVRKYLERNSIALLSNYQKEKIDPASSTWLGSFCSNEIVKQSGLWNVDHTEEDYNPSFIEKLNSLVDKFNL
jgi:hypothetical protein